MSLDDIRKAIDDNLENVPDELFNAVEREQRLLFIEISALLDELEVAEGQIVTSQANIIKVQQINEKINALLFGQDSTYVQALIKYGKGMKVQSELTKSYFKELLGEFENKPIYDDVVKAAQTTAIDALTQDAINSAFNQPLKNILNQSVSTGVKKSEAVESLRQFVQGGEFNGNPVDGKLIKYVKQVARDGFSVADRQLVKTIATDLEMEWWIYGGSVVKDSRKFCKDRVGKYFHSKEVEGWAALDWQGKAPVNEGTIFIILGGYNCLHTALPVIAEMVPKEVIQRNIQNGNYEPK